MLSNPEAERVLRVLEEIRELQREHLATYRVAVHNQEESIQLQRGLASEYRRRLRTVLVLGSVAVVAACALVIRILMEF